MITQYLGNSSRIKVLQFLIQNKKDSFSVREILLGAAVKHRNLVEILKDLLDKDMIYIERKIGRSKLYQINKDHPHIHALIDMEELNIKKRKTKICNR